MAAIGVGHTIGEILAPLQNARLLLGTLCANFVILPLASFGLAVGLRLDDALAEGLILMGMASGAPYGPKLTELAGGNLQFAVATMGLLTAGTIVYIPPVLPLLIPEVMVSPLTVARPLLLFVLLPLALGLATRAQSENLARWLKPILDRISNTTLIPVIILVAALNVDNVLHVFGTGDSGHSSSPLRGPSCRLAARRAEPLYQTGVGPQHWRAQLRRRHCRRGTGF